MCRINAMKPIQEAISIAGNITKLAKGLGVTPQAVCFWRDGKRETPADKCPLIEQMTGVSCERLRPDVAWAYIRNTTTEPIRPVVTPNQAPQEA